MTASSGPFGPSGGASQSTREPVTPTRDGPTAWSRRGRRGSQPPSRPRAPGNSTGYPDISLADSPSFFARSAACGQLQRGWTRNAYRSRHPVIREPSHSGTQSFGHRVSRAGGHMSGIRVTPEQLAALSGRVSSGATSIEGELQSLAAALAPLGSDWAGVAQQRFEALWAEGQRSARGLHEALTGVSALLGQAGSHYAEAERAIAASFGAM